MDGYTKGITSWNSDDEELKGRTIEMYRYKEAFGGCLSRGDRKWGREIILSGSP